MFQFDVALSFAGEDRAYVHEVAALLRQAGIHVFYDEFLAADLWGSDLYTLLDDVYRKKARFVVAFVSKYYVNKPWTRHERQSAQARALLAPAPYFLPVRLDDSELPGLRPTIAYVDARRTSATQLVALIQQKLDGTPGVTAPVSVFVSVPRTFEQQRNLLAQRPPGWEYLLHAGVLLQRKDALEPKWYSHEIGYTGRTSRRLDGDLDASTFYAEAFTALIGLESDGNKLFDPRVKQLAFGLPDEPGDPARIEHLATCLMDVYEELLNWAASIRGLRAPDHWTHLFELTGQLANRPLEDIRQFVDRFVAEAKRIQERIARGERVRIEPTLKLEADDKAVAEYQKEARRVQRRLDGDG